MATPNKGAKKYKIIISLLMFFIISIFALGSLHLYDYTENDPKFCLNCHLMKDAFHRWETSVHKGVNCHTCHHATLYEKNMMFFKTIFERPTEVSARPHDQIIVPSTLCVTCHLRGKEEIKKVSRSKGHSLHWFKENIECTACHAIELHKFDPEQKFCVNCHAHAKTLLPKKQGMTCTQCHDFGTGKLIPDDKKCFECHEDKMPSARPATASKAHHPFGCNTCHQTHNPKKVIDESCVECHQGAMKRGKHPVHLKTLGNSCKTCHTPHQWRITRKRSLNLCKQCHRSYSLKAFSRS
ncbi:MAG: hypothetical protein GWM98_24375 [Nitrospinaceae bacterium]|nr:hypothetical protein [Nitrospinaceae bacterium]NIR57022.1 hypothetical protein [Nitrospinaceae bacterium]NIS87475.1 hypothetical protein [Nitrospinaceae bacterium]NIT84329.1 hypothetical protein [Nitrospinaceae bacterium]NIU46518.1 hypothetical protein [Nitrospinaceae bacterium]